MHATVLILGAAAAEGGSPPFFMNPMVIMLVGMLGVVYFMTIRPQQRQQKEHENLLKKLKNGDRVKTAGGIHGTIAVVKDKTLMIEIADKVKIEVERGSVVAVLNASDSDDDKN